jgi:hypothetical protein
MRILRNLVVCTASDLSNLPCPSLTDIAIIVGSQAVKFAVLAAIAFS